MNEAARRRAGDALAAVDLVARAGLSLTIVGRAGPVRDMLLTDLGNRALRLPASADPAELDGGVDALASLAAGRTVRRQPLPERLGGRVLLVAGAERIEPALAALLARWIDEGVLNGLVLLDEGEGGVPAVLADRVAMSVAIDDLSGRDLSEPIRDEIVPASDGAAALCEAAHALGIASLRAPIMALRVAAAAGDAAFAVRVVLAPRARQAPALRDEPAEAPAGEEPADQPLGDGERLIEAARSALPPGLLAGARGARSGGAGSTAATRGASARGRLGRVRRDRPGRAGRLDLVATLIAAAPMQRARGREAGAPPLLRGRDLSVRRRQPRQRQATIFAVDASGSAALARLGEVKGAIERLLAESYVRRDEVALVAFRGTGAEVLLPPTRSLARALRELADLPGGGGTPLASGIAAGLEQALLSRAAGRAVLLVTMTDGAANIARDGSADRAAAASEALAAAGSVAAAGVDALVIDSSPRGSAAVRSLAAAMEARYLALPRAGDDALAGAVAAAR